MKLFLIAKKELDLILAQKLALLLVLLYPFIIMFLLSISFSDVSSFENIKIGVLMPQSQEAEKFFETVKQNQKLSLTYYPSLEAMKADLASKKIVIGIEVENISSEYSSKTLNFYYDNSNILTSKIFSNIAKIFVQNVGYESVKLILQGIFQEFLSVKDRITAESSNIDSLINSINSLSDSINSIDLSKIDEMLLTQQTAVDSINKELSAIDANISYFDSALNDASKQIISIEQMISSYKTMISQFQQRIDNYSSTVDSGIATINSLLADSSISSSQKAELQAIKDQLISVKNDLAQTKNDLTQINLQLNQTSSMIATFKLRLSLASSALSETKEKISNFKNLAKNSSTSIITLSSQLQSIKLTLDKVKEFLGGNNDGLISRLNESKVLLSDFLSKIERLSKFDPEALSHPIIVKEKPLFLLSTTTALMPSVIAIVLLFSCVLLTAITIIFERNQGASLRMKLSTTANLLFVFGRILGQLIVAFLISLVMFFVAFILGVQINASIIDIFLAILIVSFSFISLGILITNLTKVQSSAILLALLFMIPMLFLSGILFPIEFMQDIIASFSNLLPLTVANNLLSATLVKNQPILFQLPNVLLLIVPAFLIIIFSVLREEGKIEFEELGIIQSINYFKEWLYQKGIETAEQLKTRKKEEELFKESFEFPKEEISFEEIKKEIPEFKELK